MNRILLIAIGIQLFRNSLCGHRGPPITHYFEIERDSSGEDHADNINGYVEKEPPDAKYWPMTRGFPASDDTETARIAETEPAIATTEMTETTVAYDPETEAIFATSSAITEETTQKAIKNKQEPQTVEPDDVTPQIDENTPDFTDQAINCPMGPQANMMHGFPGRDGLPGRDGNPGVHGIPGIPGAKGESGTCDCRKEIERLTRSNEFYVPNIHQCSWNKLSWSLEAGKVVTCTFHKKRTFTSLKVEWYGALRILCNRGSPCCNRWYITFNGAECSNPMTIDGVIFTEDHNATINIHRATAIAGICSGLPQGLVDVSLWTGGCDGIYPSGPSRTGWNSASRIIIEEIPV